MSKQVKTVQELLNQAKELGKKITNLLDGSPEPTNYEFKDADGVVLFTTEKEDDSIAVGDPASPDGTYELPDERTVVITGGVVESISDPQPDATEVENLQTENASLKEELTNANTLITELSNHISSNFKPTPRTKTPGGQTNVLTAEELRNETKSKRDKMKGIK